MEQDVEVEVEPGVEVEQDALVAVEENAPGLPGPFSIVCAWLQSHMGSSHVQEKNVRSDDEERLPE